MKTNNFNTIEELCQELKSFNSRQTYMTYDEKKKYEDSLGEKLRLMYNKLDEWEDIGTIASVNSKYGEIIWHYVQNYNN